MLTNNFLRSSGECENDSECPSSQACYNFRCRDPCLDACGQSAQCQARNHGKSDFLLDELFWKIHNLALFNVKSEPNLVSEIFCLGAICSCPQGYVGDPLSACRPTRERSGNIVGLSRFRRQEVPFFMTFF